MLSPVIQQNYKYKNNQKMKPLKANKGISHFMLSSRNLFAIRAAATVLRQLNKRKSKNPTSIEERGKKVLKMLISLTNKPTRTLATKMLFCALN
jgi:hypothetical protein